MSSKNYIKQAKEYLNKQIGIKIVSFIVAMHGVLIIASTLLVQFKIHHSTRITYLNVDIPLLIGLSLIYLGIYLKRKKRSALVVTVLAYTFYMGLNIQDLIILILHDHYPLIFILKVIVLPLAIISLLIMQQKYFIVKSDTHGFRLAIKFSLFVLLISFLYGVGGFLLMDRTDFHTELSVLEAIHHTLDQFDLTTTHTLHPYTKRAHIFLDSLSFVSIGSIIYILFVLVQPLKSLFIDQTANREKLIFLLHKYPSKSEDYFKIWPHDKQYFFDSNSKSALAIKINKGVALCLGDPSGDPKTFKRLLQEFHEVSYSNDWLPAMIHVEHQYNNLYLNSGYQIQKIGQEAIVDINHFQNIVLKNKYFRHIKNKFNKQNYTYELLTPPHHQAIIDRLEIISNEWLKTPGRVERQFAMGYFYPEYLQKCELLIARDAANTIQGFLNKVPATFDNLEATYDLLRHSSNSLSNINDFLLISFIGVLNQQNYKYLNLGLCPLAGLDEHDEKQNIINNILRLVYANGDRFYSFSGLYKFKIKYEPTWRDRYIAYQGGIRGFTRTMHALTGAMKYRKHHNNS